MIQTKPKKPKLNRQELIEAFDRASRFVVDCGFSQEIEWQRGIKLEELTEKKFLSESAWVILSSGMRESVVRVKFQDISEAFRNWDAQKICMNTGVCRGAALNHFNHKGKIEAIIKIVEYISEKGFYQIKISLVDRGVEFIQQFPYMGPATSYHLAKNIGIDVAKPDRHLVRISEAAGFGSVNEFCGAIAKHTGERVSVIDVILWRYATLRKDYLDVFKVEGICRPN